MKKMKKLFIMVAIVAVITSIMGSAVFAETYEVPKGEMKAEATNEAKGYEASKAIDDDFQSMWHTGWDGVPEEKLPQSITLDLGKERIVSGIRYWPRDRAGLTDNGDFLKYKVYAGKDANSLTEIKSGEFAPTPKSADPKMIEFKPVQASVIKIEVLEGVKGFASAAELDVIAQDSLEQASETKTQSNPKTGDNGMQSIIIYMCIFLGAAIVMAITRKTKVYSK